MRPRARLVAAAPFSLAWGEHPAAMLELDMTGYFEPGTKEVIALEADYMDSGETAFLKQLVETYSGLDWAMDAPVRDGLSSRVCFFADIRAVWVRVLGPLELVQAGIHHGDAVRSGHRERQSARSHHERHDRG